MTESEFNEQVEDTLLSIEDAIDDSGADIDCENSGGVLTLSCEDGSAIITSRQVASQELWVAARSGGFHFTYHEEQADWQCTRSGQSLWSLLASMTEEQAGVRITRQ